MTARVDLIWLGAAADPPAWPLGAVKRIEASPRAVHDAIAVNASGSGTDAWLFWDSALTAPAAQIVIATMERPGDVWHGGLALGLGGAPGMIDFIAPTWTFNRDPDPSIHATSWRLSFRACLARTSVLRWSAPRADFDTLDGAALEWGHRIIMHGALPRHAPDLLSAPPDSASAALTLSDELRFVRLRFGTRWAAWAAARAAITGYAPFERVADAWLSTAALARDPTPPAFVVPSAERRAPRPAPSVSVLIPTLDRYDFLRTVLTQLRSQTMRPAEIIVVDQTPAARRDVQVAREFGDLPLTVITLDAAGQCSSRNAGLLRSRGEAVLFVDDDDEVAPDLIARHIAHIIATGADVSSGVAQEPTSGPLPDAFTRARASDVFPTNNTLAQRAALERSGLFDLAYEHGPRADGDLGMRIYLSGAVMLLDPSISVLHHHAPRGGLRAHGARVVTYASSRRRVVQRSLPEVTELYRSLRYFTERQVHEGLVQAAMGTFSVRGAAWKKLAKIVIGAVMMPVTVIQLRRRSGAAHAMLARFPQIAALPARTR